MNIPTEHTPVSTPLLIQQGSGVPAIRDRFGDTHYLIPCINDTFHDICIRRPNASEGETIRSLRGPNGSTFQSIACSKVNIEAIPRGRIIKAYCSYAAGWVHQLALTDGFLTQSPVAAQPNVVSKCRTCLPNLATGTVGVLSLVLSRIIFSHAMAAMASNVFLTETEVQVAEVVCFIAIRTLMNSLPKAVSSLTKSLTVRARTLANRVWKPQPPCTKNIAVLHCLAGMSGTVKLFNHLDSVYPHHRVRLLVPDTYQGLLAPFKKAACDKVVIFKAGDAIPFQPDVVVAYPYNRAESIGVTPPFNKDTPSVLLRDYGCGHLPNKIDESSAIVSLGPGENELGCMFDHSLYAHALASSALTPAAKLAELNGISAELKEAIFSGSSIEEFVKHSKLYFGYSHASKAKEAFVEAITRLHFENKMRTEHTPCFVLVGKALSLFELALGLDTGLNESDNFIIDLLSVDPFIACRLSSLGIHELELLIQSDGLTGPYKRYIVPLIRLKEGEVKKSIKIITVAKLDHSSMLAFLKASEREVLATGKQFLTEALSLMKFVVYEMREHTLNLVKSLVAVAKTTDDFIGMSVAKLFVPAGGVAGQLSREDPYNVPKDMATTLQHLNRHVKVVKWDSFIKRLMTNHTCFGRIEALINKKLALTI